MNARLIKREEELLSYAMDIKEYCSEPGECKDCIFGMKIYGFNKVLSCRCVLSGSDPEDWEVFKEKINGSI